MAGQQKATNSIPPSIVKDAKSDAYSTGDSQAVSDPSTNPAQRCLTCQIGRDGVFSTWYGRKRHQSLSDIYLLSNVHSHIKATLSIMIFRSSIYKRFPLRLPHVDWSTAIYGGQLHCSKFVLNFTTNCINFENALAPKGCEIFGTKVGV